MLTFLLACIYYSAQDSDTFYNGMCMYVCALMKFFVQKGLTGGSRLWVKTTNNMVIVQTTKQHETEKMIYIIKCFGLWSLYIANFYRNL